MEVSIVSVAAIFMGFAFGYGLAMYQWHLENKHYHLYLRACRKDHRLLVDFLRSKMENNAVHSGSTGGNGEMW